MRKLVRDRIPEMIERDGQTPVTRQLDEAEFHDALWKKLWEEVAELEAEPSVEEIADVIEVLLAIARALGSSAAEVDAVRVAKRQARGGFEQRVWLEAVRNS